MLGQDANRSRMPVDPVPDPGRVCISWHHGDQESSASLSARRSSDQVGALPDPALKVKLDSMPEDIALLNSDDPAEQLEATTRFRKLLSIERNPPIAEVIAAGAVPRLVQFCQCCACRRIHFFAP